MAKAATAELQSQMLSALQALAPATDAVPVTPSDTVDLEQEASAIACGGNAGTVKLRTAAGKDRTISIATGQTIAVRFKRVFLTGTSATGLSALLSAVALAAAPTPTPSPQPTPQPSLSLSSAVTKAEGNSGTTAFTWTLTLNRDGSTAAYPFAWAVTGNGSNPASAADFGGALPSGSGTFAAGETSKTITVLVTGDTAVEPDETFLLTVTASGLNTVTSTGTISNDDASTVSPVVPPNWDYIAFGDSRVENGLGAGLGSSGYKASQSMLSWASLVPQASNNRLRLGRYPNFGISASNTFNGSLIPRRPATYTSSNTSAAATQSTPPTWYRGSDSTNKGIDYAAAHPAGIVMIMHGGADNDLDSGARTRFQSYITYLRANAPQKLIVILNEPPFGVNQAGAVVGGSSQSVMDFAAWQKTFDYASGHANATPNVIVVDTNALIADPASGPTTYLNKQGFYRDDRHFTAWGSQQVARAIHQRLNAAFGSTYSGLPSRVPLPVSNGATIATDTIGVHPGFVHTNPLLTPGGAGSVIAAGFASPPPASSVPQGWTLSGSSAVMGADITVTVDKTGTDPDGYPMTTITLAGTMRSAKFTGSISGTTLTIESMDTSQGAGSIVIGATLYAGTSSYFIQALLSGTANTAGATYQVSSGAAKPSGTSMVAVTGYNVSLYQSSIAGSGSEIALTDKLRPVGRVVPLAGSKLFSGAELVGYVRNGGTPDAKAQQSGLNNIPQGGNTNDLLGYLLSAYGYDAGGATAPLNGQMIDLADPNMDPANGGPGFITAPGSVIQVNVSLANASGFDQPALAVVQVSRCGLARVSN
ncbi:spike base protein, RCAP_Rcc01079 family [Sphingomonas trueperi]|uniref:spike base protein, RCAP_Rcc01079 family n=1 Tax=Sphingomonas trueperi TaxID=53317 RepID=UPI000EAB6B61